MPTSKKTWSLYGVPDELVKEVKKYAIDNNATIADAVSHIIRDWIKSGKNKEKMPIEPGE